jgi:hypothetical protein
MVTVINASLEGWRIPHFLTDANSALGIRAMPYQCHSPYQPNLLLLMTNIETVKQEKRGIKLDAKRARTTDSLNHHLGEEWQSSTF